MKQMVEIPVELIKEANRLGLDATLLARRVMRRAAQALAEAECVVLSPMEERGE